MTILPNVWGIKTQSPYMSAPDLKKIFRFLKNYTDLCMSEAHSLEVWQLHAFKLR